MTVIAEAGRDKHGKVLWSSKCDCGLDSIAIGSHLTSGNTKSCGHHYFNSYRMSDDGSYMIGKFQNGTEFVFDAEDHEKIQDHTWYRDSKDYAFTFINGKHTKLHRFLMNARDDILIDHINLDIKDNRKLNLRFATTEENIWNVAIRKNNRTGAKGVSYDPKSNKYVARIMVSGKRIHLGRFYTLIEASETYDLAANQYFGKFAWLNNLREKTIPPVLSYCPTSEKYHGEILKTLSLIA